MPKNDCDDSFTLFSCAKQVTSAIFLPGLVVAKAVCDLEKMVCLGKPANKTSVIVSAGNRRYNILQYNIIRHVTLQNRAAIDFSVLAHSQM